MVHLWHKNNGVPHFPHSIGRWDTFPIKVFQGRTRFEPKSKKAVIRFMR